MGKGFWKNDWLVQIAVVIGYSLVYSAIRPFSDAHWALTAGLRLACLLLIPYRYWFALAVADAIPLSVESYLYVNRFGMAWALICAIPPTAIAMPIVWWCRSRLSLFPSKQLINFKTLLECVLLVSLTWSLINFGAIAVSKQPVGQEILVKPIMVVGLFIGKYIAILSIVPWALMARVEFYAGKLNKRLLSFRKSELATDTLILLVPSLLFLAWLSHRSNEESRQIAQMAMFLPVAWLTLKHGWRGAALSGTLAIICICLLLASHPDSAILQTQAFIAFTVTCMYALGARITVQHKQEQLARTELSKTLKFTQESLYQAELRMRHMSQALEQAGGALQLTHNSLLARFVHMIPLNDAQRYHKQAAATQKTVYRLVDAMHPIAWRDKGLPAAFNETIARILDEAGITYACEMTGRGLSQLSPQVHSAIYRMAVEAVVYACSLSHCNSIDISLRGGTTNGQRWAVLRIEGSLDGGHVNDPLYNTSERKNLASKLGASGLSLPSIRDHVLIYNGELHVRSSAEKLRITMLMHDEPKEARAHSIVPAPVQLWVG